MEEKKIVRNKLCLVLFGLFVLFMTVMAFPKDVYAGTKELTMRVGDTVYLYPASDDSDYRNRTIHGGAWSSGGPQYVAVVSDASVHSSCKLEARKAFSSPIYVQLRYDYYLTSGNFTYLANGAVDYKITVENVPPTSVSLSPGVLELNVGEGAQLTPSLTPSDAETTYSYSSSNSSVASVSDTGYVNARSAGNATITVETANGKKANCFVTVRQPALILSRTVPSNNETGVPVSQDIKFVYNQNIAQGSNFSSITLSDNTAGGKLAIACSTSGSVLTVTPSADLKQGHSYTVDLPQGALKWSGSSALSPAASISFTTKPMEVLETSPAEGSINVGRDSAISVRYAGMVQKGGSWNRIALSDKDGNAVPYTASAFGNTVTVRPSVTLDYGMQYTLTLPVGAVVDEEGVAVESCTVSFTTRPGALEVSDTVPKDGAEGVSVDIVPSMDFKYLLSKGESFSGISFRNSTSGQKVSGEASISGSILRFTPDRPLNYDSEYKLEVPIGALRNQAGEGNREKAVFTFRTVMQEAEKVDAPEITVAGTAVTINAVNNASIYYTLDGSNPVTDGVLYSKPFTIPKDEGTTIIRAVAVKNGSVSLETRTIYDAGYGIKGHFSFGGKGNDYYNCIKAAEDGYVAVGYSEAESFGTGNWTGTAGKGNRDAVIVKYDRSGKVEWRKSFGGKDHDNYASVAVVEDGYVAVGFSWRSSIGTGDWSSETLNEQSDAESIIVKYNKSGEIEWKRRLPGSVYGFESIAVSDDGYVVAGYLSDYLFGANSWADVKRVDNSKYLAIIVKYDKSGNVLWKKNFGGYHDRYLSVTATKDGYVAVGVSLADGFGKGNWIGVEGNGQNDAIIVKYNKSGEVLWKRKFGGSGIDVFYSVAAVEGGYIAAGLSWTESFGTGDWIGTAGKGEGDTDAIIVKYDKSGNVLWKKNFGGSGHDRFASVEEVENGYVAVGYSGAGSFGISDWSGITGKGSEDAILVRYDESGNMLWKKNFGGSGLDGYLSVVETDGRYIAVGYSEEGSFGKGDWSGINGKGKKDAIVVTYQEPSKEPAVSITPKPGVLSVSGKDTLRKGEEFTAAVYFKPTADVSAANIVLTYPECLSYVGKESSYQSVYASESQDGDMKMLNISCDFMADNPILVQGTECLLAELRFKVSESCENGDYALAFDSEECFVLDSSYQKLGFEEVENQEFSIRPTTAKEIFILGDREINMPTQYRAAFFPSTAGNTAVTWSVSDEGTASIDGSGRLVPHKNGNVTVRAYNAASGVTAELDVKISGLCTYIDSLASDTGEFAEEYENADLERTLYVPEGTLGVALTATFQGGSLTSEEYGVLFNGIAKRISITGLPQRICLTKKESGFDDTVYTLVIRTRPVEEQTPDIQIDFSNERLTGFEVGGVYMIDGTETVLSNGMMELDDSMMGSTLTIVKKGNGDTTIDSRPQELRIPARPAAPAGIWAFPETVQGENDGIIMGVSGSMEYRKSDAGSWTSCTGSTVEGLEAETYQIRIKATETSFAGYATAVTVFPGQPKPDDNKDPGDEGNKEPGNDDNTPGDEGNQNPGNDDNTPGDEGNKEPGNDDNTPGDEGNKEPVNNNGQNSGNEGPGNNDGQKTENDNKGPGEQEESGNNMRKVTGISISAASRKIAAGKKVTLKAAVKPENATVSKVKWTSGNKKYATVNSRGVVKTKKAGAGRTVKITAAATDGSGKTAVVKIKLMKNAVTGVEIKNAPETLKAGSSIVLETDIKTNGGNVNKTLKWTSSKPKYASVNAKGKVNAKKAGRGKTVVITAASTDGTNKKAKIRLTIK